MYVYISHIYIYTHTYIHRFTEYIISQMSVYIKIEMLMCGFKGFFLRFC